MINFFIGTLVQIYKFTKKDESRTGSGDFNIVAVT